MEEMERRGLDCLPVHLQEAVIRTNCQRIEEIRLRLMRPLSVTTEGENHLCDAVCSKEDLEYTVNKLCQGSLYSYADRIREGVIPSDSGIRAGVAGQAVMVNGRVEYVRDISSVCIRIPHRVKGAADELFRNMGERGVLIFAPPGCGKTTILRELIPLLGQKQRTAVIDTRYELCVDRSGGLVDVFAGYPRGFGIRSAVRTMSPEVIVCDEIAGEEDIQAILEAHYSGVAVCASVHGRTAEELYGVQRLKPLFASGVFSVMYGRKNRTDRWELIEQYESKI